MISRIGCKNLIYNVLSTSLYLQTSVYPPRVGRQESRDCFDQSFP